MHREQLARIDGAFRKETRDPQWSPATAAAVQAALVADNELRMLVRGVECRSHTCRVELLDDGSGKLGALLPALAQAVSPSLPGVLADHGEDARGAPTVVLYMSR
jgi:hypothetical protein